jgi:hypothetical protein
MRLTTKKLRLGGRLSRANLNPSRLAREAVWLIHKTRRFASVTKLQKAKVTLL